MTLKVYYPHGGKHFLLHWWTYNDRGHIVLAKTEDHVLDIAIRVFEKHPDAEIRDYMEVEIVAPPTLYSTQAEALALRDRIDNFHSEVFYRLREVVEAKKTIPPQFEVCTIYEPEYEQEKEDEWAVRTHYSCKNCFEKIKMPSMNKTQLYEKYSEAWRKSFPRGKFVDEKLVVSQAETAKDDEELFFANAAFGHHSSGIELNKIEQKKIDPTLDYRPPYLSGNAIFFFRKIRDVDSKGLQELLDQQKKIIKERENNQEKSRTAKRKKDELVEIEATLAFFRQ